MWDMGREDETLIATSGMGSDSHREPVTKVTLDFFSLQYQLPNTTFALL